MAGVSTTPNKSTLNNLLSKGIHVKYEIVNENNNDCSLSNYVVLNKPTSGYYNIEVQHGALETQKIMIDILMSTISDSTELSQF